MSKMFLILQLFGPVTSLAKLRENCETKQKIEFSLNIYRFLEVNTPNSG